MKITFNRITYDLKDEAKPYYALLTDFIGNKINFLFNYIEMYELSEEEEFLNSFTENADETHKLFDGMIDQIMAIMNKEGLKGKPSTLIKLLKEASNFDWKDMNKFKEFGVVYQRILKNLSKLS